MARIKIDYGIDLGTTNSAICRMEKGVPVIKKIEVTDDTMPSCVFFNRRGGTVVGASAYRSMKSDKKMATKSWNVADSNTYVEFKRTMGTDKIYESKNMADKGLKATYTSEELSSEVLKALKSFVTRLSLFVQ
jgi:molecular chaperone DnaK